MKIKEKQSSLQALRGLAFFAILCFHCGWSSLGFPGVSIFFVLSGFVLEYRYREETPSSSLRSSIRFSWNHIKRLYPLHILTLLLAAALVLMERLAVPNPAALPWDAGEFLANGLLLQAWSTMPIVYISYNGVSWFLSVCVFLYLVFPKMHTLIGRYGGMDGELCKVDKGNRGIRKPHIAILVTYGIMVLLAFLSQYVTLPPIMTDNFPKWFTYICPLYRMGDFFIGANMGYLYAKWKVEDSKAGDPRKLCILFSLLEIMVFAFILWGNVVAMEKRGPLGAEWARYTVLFLPASALLVYLFAINQGVIARLLTQKVLVFVGDMSGYAFLIHQLLYRCLEKFFLHFGWEIPTGIYICLTFLGSIVLAYLWSIVVKQWKAHLNDGIINR